MELYINKIRIKEKQELSVSPLKKFICWIFKISPARKFYIKINCDYTSFKGCRPRIADRIITLDQNLWSVTSVSEKDGLELFSMTAIDFMCPCGEAFFLSNGYPEGSDKPQGR